MSESDLITLGKLMLRFLEDKEVFIWLDKRSKLPGNYRLVIDGNIWGLSEEEQRVIELAAVNLN